MKTSLEHLPEKKQRRLATITKLICESAEVEMVILFGSHARGDWVEDPIGGYFSDYDVLIVVKSPHLVEKYQIWSDVENRLSEVTAPSSLNLIVHHIKDVNDQLEKGFYFFTDIKREGIVLYDSERFQLAEAIERTQTERKAYAQLCFQEWFESAGHFYEDFEANLAKDRRKKAAFELHQATERFYHCASLVLSAYKPKSHNLSDLGKRAAALHPALRGVFPQSTAEEQRLFKLLKHAYVDARYNVHYTITPEELETLAGWVRDLRDRVETVCKERLEAMGA